MSVVVELWSDLVQGISNVFSSSNNDSSSTPTESAKDAQIRKLQLTRQRLIEIAQDTILDPDQLQACTKTIERAGGDYLSLFDYKLERRQRTSKKLAGQYLPFCLKNEIEERLKPTGRSVINTEERLQLLCLYLLWTSDTVLEVSSGRAFPHKLQSLQQSTPPMTPVSSPRSANVAGNGRNFPHAQSSQPKDAPMIHTGIWFISYRSMMSSRRFVLDLRLLQEGDVIPPNPEDAGSSQDINMQTLIRGNNRMIEQLVSKDSNRFSVSDQGCHGLLHLTARRYERDEFGCSTIPLKQFDDLTVKAFGYYSLEQAQLIAGRMYGVPNNGQHSFPHSSPLTAQKLARASSVHSGELGSNGSAKLSHTKSDPLAVAAAASVSKSLSRSKSKNLSSMSADEPASKPCGLTKVRNVDCFSLVFVNSNLVQLMNNVSDMTSVGSGGSGTSGPATVASNSSTGRTGRPGFDRSATLSRQSSNITGNPNIVRNNRHLTAQTLSSSSMGSKSSSFAGSHSASTSTMRVIVENTLPFELYLLSEEDSLMDL